MKVEEDNKGVHEQNIENRNMRKIHVKEMWELFLKKYYDKTPIEIKKVISPIVIVLKFRILSRIKHLYMPVYLLAGKEKYGKSDLSILFLGDKISRFHISSVLFSNENTSEFIGKVWLWKTKKIVKQFTNKVDAVLIKTDRFFSECLNQRGFIIMPAWVEMKLDTSRSFEQLLKKFKKSAIEDIRIIKKQEYTYEVTNDSEKFEYFYHKIRVPYLSERLGKLTLPDTVNYGETKDIFQRNKLLLVKDKDKYVSGFFLASYKNMSHACYMGVFQPSTYLSKGAGAAPYYFSILWAKDNNIKLLDFGNNRSLLKDGSFQYKRKWGSTVKISKRFFGIYGLKIINYQKKAIQDFLLNNPFTIIQNRELKGIVFLRNRMTNGESKRIYSKYYTTGLENLYIFSIQKNLKEIAMKLVKKTYKKKIDAIQEKIITYSNGEFRPIEITDHPEENYDIKDHYQYLISKHDLNIEQVKHIFSNKYEKQFEKLINKFPNLKNEIIRTFLHTFSTFKREGINLEKIDGEMLNVVFDAISTKTISKEAIPDILRHLVKNNTYEINEAVDSLNLNKVKYEEIKEMVEKIVLENKECIETKGISSLDFLMGIIMKELHGKADGEIVSIILKEKIENMINS